MTWYVTSSGVVQAASKPSGAVGPFPTQAAAAAYVASHKELPVESTGPLPTNPSQVAAPIASAIPGVGNIDDAIKFITQGSLWERAVEIVGGLLLLYIGIKAMVTPAGQSANQQSFKKTAGHVAEAVAVPK